MVEYSINWLCCKVFHWANFRFGFEEVQIDIEQVLWLANSNQTLPIENEWMVNELTMWYGLKIKKIKNKESIKNNAK